MKKPLHDTHGFSLVEVTLALGIAGFCLLAIFGLFPVGINSNRVSIEQTIAANMASQVMADLEAIPKGLPPDMVSPRYRIPAPPAPGTGSTPPVPLIFFLREDGTLTGDLPKADAKPADNPRYRVAVTYNVPSASQRYFAVPTQILISWPPLVSGSARSAGSFESSGSLTRN